METKEERENQKEDVKGNFNNRTTGISLFIEGYTEEKQTLNHTNGLVCFIITLMLCKGWERFVSPQTGFICWTSLRSGLLKGWNRHRSWSLSTFLAESKRKEAVLWQDWAIVIWRFWFARVPSSLSVISTLDNMRILSNSFSFSVVVVSFHFDKGWVLKQKWNDYSKNL